jgi:hypothetical protein
MGLGCAGEHPINGSIDAHPDGLRVIEGFGSNGTFDPREGSSYLVISTGDLAEIWDEPTDEGDAAYHCNSWFEPGDGMDTTNFPEPIKKNPVNGDCIADPNLVGTGDCSGSIGPQFNQSGWKYDYQEVRFTVDVPANADTLSFDVAYLTTEWPVYFQQPYNDMFVAWLEAPNWTGNISFDQQGNALSLNAALFDFYDENGNLPEFSGTCMRYSAGTPWLTTTADVSPGDTIEIVFAIFDVEDVHLDSFVFLDNFRWGCEGGGSPPETEPAG